MPPVSPGQPSSFGSVFSDAPGLLRENGYTMAYTAATVIDGADVPICSGSAPAAVTDFQDVFAPLGPGDSLNIYGLQGAHAGNTDNDPMVLALRAGPHDATAEMLAVLTSNRNGPWFQHFELPIQIEGPATGTKDVWIDVIDVGGNLPTFNRITIECIVVRKR
tara:strand:- start:44 stop:532 length:489 start_codon:yes stop_codon:yes gene_type:complete